MLNVCRCHRQRAHGLSPPPPSQIVGASVQAAGYWLEERMQVDGGRVLQRAEQGTKTPLPVVLGSWGNAMRDAARNKEMWKGRRTPTQDPSTDNAPQASTAAAAAAAAAAASVCKRLDWNLTHGFPDFKTVHDVITKECTMPWHNGKEPWLVLMAMSQPCACHGMRSKD